MKYYFFAASLPMVSLDSPPPITFEDFRALCREQLESADLAALHLIDQPDITERMPEEPAFLRNRQAIEIQIRNEIIMRRTGVDEADAVSSLRAHAGFSVEIAHAVEFAFAARTPLERERQLDELRWRLFEELGGTDPFTSDAILSFASRLRLSERWAGLTAEAGRARFQKTMERIANRQGNDTV